MGRRLGRGRYQGLDDLEGTLRLVDDDAPVILLAHEPYVFEKVPSRVALTLCGHTHGGQVNLPLLGSPFAELQFGAAHLRPYRRTGPAHDHFGRPRHVDRPRPVRPSAEVVEVVLGQAAVA